MKCVLSEPRIPFNVVEGTKSLFLSLPDLEPNIKIVIFFAFPTMHCHTSCVHGKSIGCPIQTYPYQSIKRLIDFLDY